MKTMLKTFAIALVACFVYDKVIEPRLGGNA